MDTQEAFISVIKENEGLIYKVSRAYCDAREDAEDLYQEIVYQLWKSYPSFRNESKLSTWMYRIALNTSIAHLSKQKKKGEQVPIDDSMLNRTDSNDNNIEEQSRQLFALIKKLDDIEKGIILLYLEGKSYAEIAIITGFSTSNVGTRLGRVKQKLQSQII